MKTGFLATICDRSAPVEARLVSLAQFVVRNGHLLPQPDPAAVPEGYIVQARAFGDVVVYLACSHEEAARAPTSAEPQSAQLVKVRLTAAGVDPRGTRELATLNGPVTRLVSLKNRNAARRVLAAWTAQPPTMAEICGAPDSA